MEGEKEREEEMGDGASQRGGEAEEEGSREERIDMQPQYRLA